MTAPPAGALEGCPFCGAPALGIVESLGVIPPSYSISCSDVRCLAMVEGRTAVRARLMWNRRTHGPALLAALRLREGCQGLVDSLPSNWCDPMLTGPTAVIGKPPYGCPEIEALIAAIKQRLRDDLARVLEEGE